jgi:hypothetical protein
MLMIKYSNLSSRQFIPLYLILLLFCQGAASQDNFRQEVNYIIRVTLNDKLHELTAFQTIEYINNSPDTLGYLYFHLWPNAWSGNHTRLARQIFRIQGRQRLFDDPLLQGYIDSLDFRVDGMRVEWDLLPDPDICRILLTRPINPGDTLIITTPFRVKLPGGQTSQLGHIGESYQIAHWYPKPAVYDCLGWHPVPWTDGPVIPSEKGGFDVSITLPANYIVGATGNLQSGSEIRWLDMLVADTTWKITHYYAGTRFPPSSVQRKTIRYNAANTTDFAWFADKRFNVMKGSTELPETGREVITWLMFTNLQARLWIDAPEYVNGSILYFSGLLGEYPRDNYTVVQSILGAGPGHSYPGVGIIGFEDDAASLNQAIALGIAREWFDNSAGAGDKTPLQGEGLARAYTARYRDRIDPGRKLWESLFNSRRFAEFLGIEDIPANRMDELNWLIRTRRNQPQLMDVPAINPDLLNYDDASVYHSARGFDYLRNYLGDSLFDPAVNEWYNIRNSVSGNRIDLHSFFELKTGMDLSWFFIDLMDPGRRLDYKVIRARRGGLLIENNAGLESPFHLSGLDGDSTVFEKWVEGFGGRKWIDIPDGNYTLLTIDPSHVMPELYKHNNSLRPGRIFPRSSPVRTRFLFNIDDPAQRSLVYMPLVNWTRENGFMPGLGLHNGFPLPKPVEYMITPFYSFRNSSLAGSGQILFNITPEDHLIRLAIFSLEGTRFGAPGDQNYNVARTGLDLYLNPPAMQSPLRHRIFGHYIAASDLMKITLLEEAGMDHFMQAGYEMERTGLTDPFSLLTFIEAHRSYKKASMELNFRYSYHGRNKGLDIRLFAGAMLNSPETAFHAFAASGRSGREQYLYQGTFPDRFSVFPQTFFSRQMALSEGGLVTPVNRSLGYNDWLISLSTNSSLPGRAGWIPVRPFATLLLSEPGQVHDPRISFFYEAGFKAGIWGLFEIYFPLLVSENIGAIQSPMKDRIRFVLTLNSFNRLDFLGIMN